MASIQGSIHPAGELPTAIPDSVSNQPSPTPLTPTNTPLPSPTPEESPTPFPSPTPLPQKALLTPPKWERQKMNNCGPASLTMYLRYYGWDGTQDEIANLLKPFPEDRNVNVEELAYFVRTHAGWLNIEYRVGGDIELLKELLANGFPVMIEESFYFEKPYWKDDDLWAAHYQLLTAYDDSTQTFIGQDSFHGPDLEIPYKELDEYWQAFNRVYIMIYLPDQENTIKDILGSNWDIDSNREHALEVAQTETQEDPNNAFTWFNLGTNLTFFERYIEATDAYDKAREIGLPQRMLRYQFGPFIAYFHTGQIDDLLALTEYALKITKNSEEALLWRGWAMYRLGKKNEARDYFNQALERNPNYADAKYAINFLNNNP